MYHDRSITKHESRVLFSIRTSCSGMFSLYNQRDDQGYFTVDPELSLGPYFPGMEAQRPGLALDMGAHRPGLVHDMAQWT